MPHVARLRVYPVKGFDGVERDAARIREGGTLAHDREYALRDADGNVINAKESAEFHRLSTDYDPESHHFTVETLAGERLTFDLETERDRTADWFGDRLGADLTLSRDGTTGYVDRPDMGPSVISTATLETVASWYDGLTVESARRRLRANVEVGGVPAFWEDRLVGEGAPALVAGDVRIEGVTTCGRCVVPSRDPDTGDPLPEFRQRFVEKRRETFPEWADEDAFDHFYSLMVIARVPGADRGKSINVGDAVELVSE